MSVRASERLVRPYIWRVMLAGNTLALVAFGAAAGFIAYVVGNSAPLRIADLDRAGVVDEVKLGEVYPSLTVNMRHDVGRWVAQSERRAAVCAAGAGAAVALVNVLLLLLYWGVRLRWAYRKPHPPSDRLIGEDRAIVTQETGDGSTGSPRAGPSGHGTGS